jgi:hypothetical protein
MKITHIDSSEDRTFRALLALGEDMAGLMAAADSIRLQYNALAERHGLPPCSPAPLLNAGGRGDGAAGANG